MIHPMSEHPIEHPPRQTATPSPIPPLDHYHPLDPNVVWLWRLSSTINWLVLLTLLLAAAIGLGGFLWHQLIPSLCLWTALLLFACFWIAYYPRRAHAAWGYRLNDTVLEIRKGVWFQVIQLLPLSRLQHVDLERGPLERSLNLASLTLYTAGTQEAAITLPGLNHATAAALRDTLVIQGGDDGV